MKWYDLKTFCNSLSEEQLVENVVLWREEDAISKIGAEILREDYYLDTEEPTEGCFTLSECGYSLEEAPNLKLVYEKGTPILWEDF
ncbi:MAG: hypothetical protein ACYC5G_05485 [Candidatus Doudnabacteria bacterium]